MVQINAGFEDIPEIHFIAIDLDGTLLDDEKKIDNSIRNKIMKMSDEGYFFILISGRHKRDILSYFKYLKLTNENALIISSDGQYIYDKEITTFPFLNADDLYRIMSVFSDSCSAVVTSVADYYFNNRSFILNFIRNIIKHIFCRQEIVTLNRNDTCRIKGSIEKIIIKGKYPRESQNDDRFRGKNSRSGKITCDLYQRQQEVLTRYSWHFCDSERVEIKQKGVCKWEALRKFMLDNRIGKENLAYLGDDDNDIECFENLTNTYAVMNASTKIRKAAKHIVPSNNEKGALTAFELIERENMDIKNSVGIYRKFVGG